MAYNNRRKATAAGRNRTWWNEQRIKNNLSLEDIGNATGYAPSTIGNYLSGKSMPCVELSKMCCDLMGITDHEEGFKHFTEAYKAKHVSPDAVCADPAATEAPATEKDLSMLEAVYGKVDYTTFMKLLQVLQK